MGAVAMWLSRVSVLRPSIDSFLLKCDVELHGSIAFATLPHRACEMIATLSVFAGTLSASRKSSGESCQRAHRSAGYLLNCILAPYDTYAKRR